jgi:hypothetical protein
MDMCIVSVNSGRRGARNMSLRDRKEMEDRQSDTPTGEQQTLWSSQTLDHDVGSETLYVDWDSMQEEEMSLDEALERGYIRSVPVKVWVRNRHSRPVIIQSDYDARRQLLQMEVIQTQDHILPAHGAILAWLRHLAALINSDHWTSRARGYLTVLLTLLTLVLAAAWLMGLIP